LIVSFSEISSMKNTKTLYSIFNLLICCTGDHMRFQHKLINAEWSLSFDDVLVKPGKTRVDPHEVSLRTRLCGHVVLNFPVVSAAMETITGAELAVSLARFGGMGVLSRVCSIAEQANMITQVKTPVDLEQFPDAAVDEEGKLLVGAAVPAFDTERARKLEKAGADVLFLDCTQPYHTKIIDFFSELKKECSTPVVVGNVVLKEAAHEFIESGADGLKVGLGAGSVCSTRNITGAGVAQLSAVAEVADAASHHNIPVISDGGIRHPGDVVKALVAGADAVMIGGLFAGCNETPGEQVLYNGKVHKRYKAVEYPSIELLDEREKKIFSTHLEGMNLSEFRIEGLEVLVELKGPAGFVMLQLQRGIKTGLGFVGASTIEELREKGTFVRVTGAEEMRGLMFEKLTRFNYVLPDSIRRI
jgi:IMP dehydrogenase